MNRDWRARALFVVASLGLAHACACSGGSSPAPNVLAARVYLAEPVMGVPDRDDDPGVVEIDIDGQPECSGALVAPDVVLTARHCVSVHTTGHCPAPASQAYNPRPPATLAIRVGDDAETAVERARGRDVSVPPTSDLCGADIALLTLDRPIDDVQPIGVRSTGAAAGDRLRTVAFIDVLARGGSAGPDRLSTKLLRDHVPALDTSDTELRIEEGGCQGGGGPAIDESTGEIVGVASRAGPAVVGVTSDVYTRADAFLSLIAATLQQAAPVTGSHLKKAKKGPVDMGANCLGGSDCAAGACVTSDVRRYCSRRCGAHDRCPLHFRCERAVAEGEGGQGGQGDRAVWVCVQ